MMTDYTPNSHKYKQETQAAKDKKVEKVVSGTVKTRKKNELQRTAGSIISEGTKNLKSYILMDVLVPAIKDAIEDIFVNGIRIILRGETGVRRDSNSPLSRISYNTVYDSNRKTYQSNQASRQRYGGYSYDDIVLTTRGDAEKVLKHMDGLIDTYGSVTVADLYDSVGIIGSPNDNKWGWINIANAEVVRVRDGYLIKLPKACPIE